MTQLLINNCNRLIVSLFSLFLCLNVNAQNNPPVAVNDYYFVLTDSFISANVLLNDYDPDAMTVLPIVNITPVTLTMNSTHTLNPDGTFTCAFNPGFTGVDSFSYEICDTGIPVLCDTATAYFNLSNSFIQSINTTDVTDCGLTDGQIKIIPTVTNTNWLYSIDSGQTWQTSATFSNLSGGNYNIVLRDSISTFIEYYVNNPVVVLDPVHPVVTNYTSFNPSNCGINDGGITVTATGVSLIYSIDGGINWQSNNTFIGLHAGTYPICVMNSNGTCNIGCGAYIATLTAPGTPTIDSTSMTNPTDCGLSDGTIGLFASGGSGSYEYSLDGGMTWQASNLFTGLAGGTYPVCIRNSNGSCQTCLIGGMTLTSSQVPVISNVSVSAASNCSLNDGAIIISATGQVGLEYSIDGGVTWQASNTFSGLGYGYYDVFVRNNDGSCLVASSSNSIWLNAPNVPIISSINSVDPSNCGANDGSITTTAVGISLEYSIDGGINWQSSNTFTGLACGTYDIAVRNSNGTCVVLGTQVTLTGVSVINQAPIAINDTFSGIANQAITGNVSLNDSDADVGNILLYNMQLIYGPVSGTVTINSNGIFIYTPHSGFGGVDNFSYEVCDNGTPALCDTAIVTIVLNGSTLSGNPPIISTVNVSNETCNQNDGLITIDAILGTTSLLQYSIDNGQTWQFVDTFSSLTAGNYNILVSDGFDTTAYANNPVIITSANTSVITNVTSTNPTDCGTSNGSITVTATSQTSIQYSIDSGMTWQTSNAFTGLTAGNYDVVTRNADSTCLVHYNNPVILTTPNAPVINNVSSTNPTDCGVNDGTITVTGVGQMVLEYSIDGGVTFQSSNVFTGLAGGVYKVVLRNIDGTCLVYDTNNPLVLTALTAPVITNTTFVNLTDCTANDGSITINAVGNGTLEYSIDYGTTWQSSNTFTGLSCGNYPISVRYTNGTCIENGNDVTLSPAALFIMQGIITDASCNQSNGGLTIDASGGTGNYQYRITGTTWQTSDSFPNIAAGTYTLYLTDGVDTITYGSQAVVSNFSNPPTFVSATIYSDSLFINANSSGQGMQYSIDCGVTWQASGTFFPAPMGNLCIGVQNADGTCPVFTNVNIANTAPVAATDSIALVQNGYVSFNILNNDYDVENNLFTATPQVQYYGTDSMTLNSAGVMTIPTNALNLGAYMINYQICEVYNPTNCSQGSVYFSINPPIDTFQSTMAIGATQTICIPTLDLPGTPVSTVINCGLPTNIIIDSIVGACIYAYGDDYGSDTTCVVICDNFGFCDTTVFIITVEDGVWPGDTDDDTYANNFDLLNIGLGYGLSGTARSTITNTWNGYITPNWGQSTPLSNIDYRHADCNGDGIINSDDTTAILQNYGESYQRKGAGGVLGAAPLYLLNDTSHYMMPHVSLPIILGEAGNQAIDLYGGAFSIGYDTSIVEANSVRITFDTSWVGSHNIDMISIQKNFENNQQIDAAFTRIDGLNITGHGILAKLDFTIKDDILRRGLGADSVILTLDIFNVKFISNNESLVDVNPNPTNLVLTSVEKNPMLDQYISVFPNPARNQVQVAVENIEINQITVLDMNGRMIHHNTNNTQNNITLDVATYPSGVYMLQIHTSKGIVTKRLTVIKE